MDQSRSAKSEEDICLKTKTHKCPGGLKKPPLNLRNPIDCIDPSPTSPSSYFSYLWCQIKSGAVSAGQKFGSCYKDVFFWIAYEVGATTDNGIKVNRPSFLCISVVLLSLWPILGTIAGIIYFGSGEIQNVSSAFEWLSSFILQMYQFALQAGTIVSSVLSTLFGWVFRLASSLSNFSGANLALCNLLAATAIAWASVGTLSDLEGVVQDWMDTFFYSIYHFLVTPLRYARHEAFSFNPLVGILVTILSIPFDMAVLVASFGIGGIYYCLERLWTYIVGAIEKTCDKDGICSEEPEINRIVK